MLINAKIIWKNVYPFSCKNFIAKNRRCPVAPLGGSDIIDKIPKISLYHYQTLIFAKMGVALSRPSG